MVEAEGQEILMPVLQPKENWIKTGRWNNLDILFKETIETNTSIEKENILIKKIGKDWY